jgi:thiol-disulfide isomerase/thioredoxin
MTLLTIRFFLAVVLGFAGFAKAFDIRRFTKSVRDFGFPSWTARPLGVTVPVAEIAVAYLLLSVRTAWIGARGALMLFSAFTTAIVLNLALGRKPECQCFGQVRSEAVGWSTLVRNGALGSLAVVLVWKARTNAGSSVSSIMVGLARQEILAGIFIALVILGLVVLGWLAMSLIKQNGRLLLRIEALESGHPTVQRAESRKPRLTIGSTPPPFALPDLSGDTVNAASLYGEETVLLFWNPSCGFCQRMIAELRSWETEKAPNAPRLVVLSTGSIEINKQMGLRSTIVIDEEFSVGQRCGAIGTPSGLLIDSEGNVAAELAEGAQGVMHLLTGNVVVVG